jgi:hypothetical protein
MTDLPLTRIWTWNWLISPVGRFLYATNPDVYAPPPKHPQGDETPAIFDQKWLLVMSGVVSGESDPTLPSPTGADWAVLKGNSTSNWNQQRVSIWPGASTSNFIALDNGIKEGPLYFALNNYFPHVGSPYFPTPYFADSWKPCFSVETWAINVGLAQIFDEGPSIDAGYVVDDWQLSQTTTANSAYIGGGTIPNVFTGIEANVGVKDTDAWVMKLNFQITLQGRIALWTD